MDYLEMEQLEKTLEKITHTIGGNELRYLKLKSNPGGPHIIGDLKHRHSEHWCLFQLWSIAGQWDNTQRIDNANDLNLNS
jgi:hypothetical protein